MIFASVGNLGFMKLYHLSSQVRINYACTKQYNNHK